MKIILYLVYVFCASVSAETENDFLNKNQKMSASFYKEFSQKSPDGNFLASPYSVQEFLALAIHTSRDQLERTNRLHGLPIEEIQTFNDESYKLEAYTKISLKQQHYPTDNGSFQITNILQDSRADFKAAWLTVLEPLKGHFFVGQKRVQVEALQNYDSEVSDRKELLGESYALDAKFLNLPLQGNDSSITFVLPNQKHHCLGKLESRIEKVLAFKNYREQHVRYIIPKFHIRHEFNLRQLCDRYALGSEQENKDFNTLMQEEVDVVLTERMHTTSLRFDENGVNGGIANHSDVYPVPHPKFEDLPHFVADHPFIFYVKIQGVIAFIGRVVNPIN